MASSLKSGSKLGRYEIRSRLGAGGMGEVYLAHDTTLEREVAVKILPEELAGSQTHLQRFVQEAKAASALNHPNIITVYEIGTEPALHFIVTEYIDGETLRRRMADTPLSLAKAIDVALQVASALSMAHAAGIVHRDIKPENVMLRGDGIIKVLDFGLAKLTERWRKNEVDPDATTRAILQTQPGVIVGTTAYMSPEQTRGLEVDPRTDIWSLGVLLYEMITGHTPFKGETASDTSAAILRSEPPALTEYEPDTPFELERIVRKALQKDREERYQGVKDLELDLKSLKRDLDLGTSHERVGSGQSRPSRSAEATQLTEAIKASATHSARVTDTVNRPRSRWLLPITVGVLGFVAFAGWYAWRQYQRNNTLQLANLAVAQLLSRKNELGEAFLVHARFSPDGSFIAYAAPKDGGNAIWLKQVASGEPFSNRNTGTTAPTPIWSPDGQQIAFLSERDKQNAIWIMPAFGGTPTLVKALDRASSGLIAWTKTNQIFFVQVNNLYLFDLGSQRVDEVTRFDLTKPLDRNFSVSPDANRIAYNDIKDGQSDIWVMSRDGSPPERVTNDKADDTKPAWTPSGNNILYSSKRNGVKQIFLAYLDGREPVQLTVNDSNSEVLDISPNGNKILYGTAREESDLWSVNLDQLRESQLTSDAGLELWPDVSPDGKTVAFQVMPPTTGTTLFSCAPMVKSLTTDTAPVRLAPDGFALRWSPDGKRVAFLRQTEGTPNLWTVHAAGGDATPLTTGGVAFGGYAFLPYNRLQTEDFAWSHDGTRLTYCARTSGVANVWEIAADGATPTQLSDNANGNLLFFNPSWSPDGRTVAWISLEPPAGQKKISWSIWVAREGKARQVFQSESALGLVGWSRSGNELISKSVAGATTPPNTPTDVELSVVSLSGGVQRPIAELKATYFQNIRLSPNRTQIAFVTRQNGTDSLRVMAENGGTARTIVENSDNRVYFSSLVWSADGKSIFYGKQSSWSTLSMLENFKSK
jgi:serine/threonine protein kinase/Tol biopolymer transport system component